MGPENAEMSDIFISYASRDRPKAQVLAQALMQRGWSVWWDRTKAFLVNADLRLTNLEGADLWEADLRGAVLVLANLNNAVLEGANIPGADLRAARGFTASQIKAARNWTFAM